MGIPDTSVMTALVCGTPKPVQEKVSEDHVTGTVHSTTHIPKERSHPYNDCYDSIRWTEKWEYF